MLQQNKHIYAFGPFRFDSQERLLLRDNRPVPLTPKVADTLCVLLQNAGHLVDKEELMRQVWPDTAVEEGNLNKNVFVLRKALSEADSGLEYIETVPKRGYRFIAAVKPVKVEPPEAGGFSQRSGGGAARSAADYRLLTLGFFALVCISLLASTFGRRLWKGSPENSVHSIAVLPLENLSGDASQDYFADGMTDELITNLGQIGSLRVISRTSSMKYKASHKALPQIGRELDVDAVIEGTVFRAGDRVRITAQLIQARADRHLWAGSYERDLRDVLNLQSEVATAIADQIRIKLTPQEQAALKGTLALNSESQDAYLKGHYFAAKGTIDDAEHAIPYFNVAIAKEPNHALAYAGLASAYIQLGHSLHLPPGEAFPAAKTAALKALAADNTIEEAHTALANALFLHEWNFAQAEREFHLALQLNPNSVRAENDYASFLNAMGKPDEAVATVKRALQNDPLSLGAMTSVAWQLYWARRYDEALLQLQKVLQINPNFEAAHFCLGLVYEQQHNFASALAEIDRAPSLCNGGKCFGLQGQVLALSGDKRGALEALGQVQRRSYASPWHAATVYANLGDKEQAFAWLEKCYQTREHDLVFSRLWPMFDSLRSDPRYEDLMRRVGLSNPFVGK
jgi:TolB-like protein/DNA-binding winged helix-turn-helix (wHTH) protein/Flp pilus assembly protein TadD